MKPDFFSLAGAVLAEQAGGATNGQASGSPEARDEPYSQVGESTLDECEFVEYYRQTKHMALLRADAVELADWLENDQAFNGGAAEDQQVLFWKRGNVQRRPTGYFIPLVGKV